MVTVRVAWEAVAKLKEFCAGQEKCSKCPLSVPMEDRICACFMEGESELAVPLMPAYWRVKKTEI